MVATAKYFVDANGSFLGAWDGFWKDVEERDPATDEVISTMPTFFPPKYPVDAFEVDGPPPSGDGRQVYDMVSGVWLPLSEPIPDSVTARQFKMQLAIAGLKAPVDAWVAAQDEVVQVAYEYSGTFVLNEPMMQAGFTALGFTEEQRNAFFLAASKL